MQLRRRLVRWQLDIDARLNIGGQSGALDCILHDINYNGARISFPEKLYLDTSLELRICLAKEISFCVEAWVVWHKLIEGVNIYGIYFTKIKDADKEKISKFVRSDFSEQVSKEWWKGFTEKEGGEDMDDRRIFERFQTKFPLRFIDLKENREGSAQMQDVSAKGLGFTVRDELKLRTPLEMWLQIPDKGEPLYTRGFVAWSKMVAPNEYRIGVNLERADLMGMSRALRAG